uniref:Uncharacterized protein n=1 Tax=Arundo donax TaxID=35708 RepID=A0A0A9AT58_ARUDO
MDNELESIVVCCWMEIMEGLILCKKNI